MIRYHQRKRTRGADTCVFLYRNPVRAGRKEGMETVEDKIDKWEEEIETITEKQREMIEKNNARIRMLRKKIEEAKQVIRLENNRLIAEAVREIYGEVSAEGLEDFKKRMRQMADGSRTDTEGQRL